MQYSTVPEQKLEIDLSLPETAAKTPAIQIVQLQAELWLERCLNEMQRRINDRLLGTITNQTVTQHSEAEIWQIVVEELSVALEASSVAVALAAPTASETSPASISAYQICFVSPTKPAQSKTTYLPTVKLATGKTLCLQVGQAISIEDLQHLQAQKPQQAWKLQDAQGLIGWAIAAVATLSLGTESESLAALRIQLHSQLWERMAGTIAIVISQIRRIQAIALQCQQLEARNQELIRNNQLKSEFLANTSHEIRTPLSSILGFTHLLLAQGYNPGNLKHQEYLNIILNSGQHLLALINDILDLSKIEANQLEVQLEAVAIPSLCRNVLALVKEKAHNKGLQLCLELDAQVTAVVADSLRLKQMLLNLLSNALKFTSQGTVGLQVKHQGGFIRFTVWDTGTGISPEEQALLFQPYHQIAQIVAGRQEGTGLGLALTQKLAELHGGWVEFQSELNRGSRFTIVLPITSVVEEGESGGEGEGETRGTRETRGIIVTSHQPLAASSCHSPLTTHHSPILLVEDNVHNAKLIATYLKKLGYQVTWVKDAAQMWQALKEFQPVLILLDIQLPDVDGLTLVRQLQVHERYGKIPVIAQTAMAMKGDREACLAAGATEYISKPIELKLLAALVSKYSGAPDV
jgi:signal transduction histidine kinase/ActR/RegA family two-component response regulator